MPEVSTKVDLCNGHDACAPRAFAEHSPSVFAETFEVTREGDGFQSHGCPDHAPHGAVVSHAWQYNADYYRVVSMLNAAPNFRWTNLSVPQHNPSSSRDLATLKADLRDQIGTATACIFLAGRCGARRTS